MEFLHSYSRKRCSGRCPKSGGDGESAVAVRSTIEISRLEINFQEAVCNPGLSSQEVSPQSLVLRSVLYLTFV